MSNVFFYFCIAGVLCSVFGLFGVVMSMHLAVAFMD
ncbi:MAG: hypothetical protein ACJAS1_003272 [Oleiphilaceae bacterium]|jgi:hypothetical protein